MISVSGYGSQMTSQLSSRISPVVFVVDDDISVRESLEAMIGLEGLEVRAFSSAQEFLAHPRTSAPSCMILDVSLPGLNGLELQKRISSDQRDMPIIFVTGHGDIPMSVQAMKAGAVEFLTKPFADHVLLDAIRNALDRSRAIIARDEDLRSLKERYAQLTPREREVMALVVVGLMNKHIADELGISEITVKAHRGCMMRKMNATSLAELVNMGARLRLQRSVAARRAASK
jgi:FixJ family two-component response regulator